MQRIWLGMIQEDVTRRVHATQLEAFLQARRALPRHLQLTGLKVCDGRKTAVRGSCGSGGADLKDGTVGVRYPIDKLTWRLLSGLAG